MSATASPTRPVPVAPTGAPAPTIPVSVPPTVPAPGGRWGSLDAMRALALFGMVAHHLAGWTGGRVRERWIGFENCTITDLAAPMFAVGVGAAAFLVGSRLATGAHPARVAATVVGKWVKVLALGVGLELAVQGRVDGGGVLFTLFVVGLLTTGAVAIGIRRGWAWWGIAAVCAAAAGPITRTPGPIETALEQLWSGSFALTTYLAFAAVGAAVVATAGRGGEAALPLWRATAGVLAVGLVLATLVPSAAPDGLWPPARYPGDLAFIVWGVAATLAIWAILRAVLRPGAVTNGLVRAGQRTLLVFGLHYAIKVVLGRVDLLGTLDTRRWGLATWAVTIAICVAATLPKPSWVQRRGPAST